MASASFQSLLLRWLCLCVPCASVLASGFSRSTAFLRSSTEYDAALVRRNARVTLTTERNNSRAEPNWTTASSDNSSQANASSSKDDNANSTANGWSQSVLQYATTVVIEAEIGGQTMHVVPDTGSFDLLMASAFCEVCGHRVFHTSRSKSFHLSSPLEKRNFYYGSGKLQALKAYDSFSVGPYRVPDIELFLISSLSDEVAPAWASQEFEGILGLGLKRTTTAQSMNVSQFSFCLHVFGIRGEWWNGGQLFWGGRDRRFSWGVPHPVDRTPPNMHWQLSSHRVELAGALLCQAGCSVVPDSGTSLLAVPAVHRLELQEALKNVEIDCKLTGMPRLHIALDQNETLELPPVSYVMQLSGGLASFDQMRSAGQIIYKASANHSNSEDGVCAAIFMVSQGPHWVLGMPLFRAYAVDFDRANSTISFARNSDGLCGDSDKGGGGGSGGGDLAELTGHTSLHARAASSNQERAVPLKASELSLALKRRELKKI